AARVDGAECCTERKFGRADSCRAKDGRETDGREKFCAGRAKFCAGRENEGRAICGAAWNAGAAGAAWNAGAAGRAAGAGAGRAAGAPPPPRFGGSACTASGRPAATRTSRAPHRALTVVMTRNPLNVAHLYRRFNESRVAFRHDTKSDRADVMEDERLVRFAHARCCSACKEASAVVGFAERYVSARRRSSRAAVRSTLASDRNPPAGRP